jgi:hypothetical protein
MVMSKLGEVAVWGGMATALTVTVGGLGMLMGATYSVVVSQPEVEV